MTYLVSEEKRAVGFWGWKFANKEAELVKNKSYKEKVYSRKKSGLREKFKDSFYMLWLCLLVINIDKEKEKEAIKNKSYKEKIYGRKKSGLREKIKNFFYMPGTYGEIMPSANDVIEEQSEEIEAVQNSITRG